jgi:cell volume regulation protein A
MHVENLIILVSLTILVSYISGLIYSRTRIPDVVWLMGFGVLMGPVLGYVDKGLFNQLAPLMSIIALSIILFEAGINVDIVMLLGSMGKAMVLSVASIMGSILLIGILTAYFLVPELSFLQGMLLGAMVGGTSTVAVYGILTSIGGTLPNLDSTRVLLTMESIVSDPVCIISSITLIKMILQPQFTVRDTVKDLLTTFMLSSAMGLAVGVVWAKVLDRLRTRQYTYMITLAVLLPTYIMSEQWAGEGGGAVTALVFGLAVTNYRYIMEQLGSGDRVLIDKKRLREFHDEVTFFVKSFFFVYIGVVVSLSVRYAFIGFGLVILQIAMRYGIVAALSGPFSFTREERVLSQVVYASGLPAFVMSQLPQIFDPDRTHFINPQIYPDLCMPIVLGTILFSGILGPALARRALMGPEAIETR